MGKELSLDELWESARSGKLAVFSDQGSGLPKAARRYLEHAIAPGTSLATAVRLRMHGEIKLGRWLPFRAERVIYWDRGMIWSATARMHGIPIRDSDRLVNCQGAVRWNLFGIIPVMTASGSDITRSTVGRVQAESLWLPSVLRGRDVSWTATDSSHLHASFTTQCETAELTLIVDNTGRLVTLKLPRWGNPESGEFHYEDFGGIVEQQATFSGYTIPTRLRVGWYYGTERFESEGKFFRVTIDDAVYRPSPLPSPASARG